MKKKILLLAALFLAIHCFPIRRFIGISLLSTLLITNCYSQWVQMNNGMGNITVMSLAYSGNYLFAGTSAYGIYLSTNEGSSWAQSVSPIPSNHVVYAMAVNGNYIFAGTGPGNGVYLSTNNGINWSQTSLNNRHVWSLAVNGNTIFAGTQVWGVYLSTDNGITWEQTSLNNRSVYSIAVNGNLVYAGINGSGTNQGVYLSTDNGINWVQTSLNNSPVLRLAIKGDIVFAGTYLNGLYLSANSGTNWTPAGLTGTIDALAVNGNNIFAKVRNVGIHVSVNGGSWTLWNEGLTSNLNVNNFCILNNYIFAGTFNYSVYRRPLSELTGTKPISNEVPSSYSLSQNYPNPFNPVTKIKFDIKKSVVSSQESVVTLKVFEILGKEVSTLVNEQLKSGTYEVEFNGSNLPSGVYFYQLKSENYSDTKKLTLLK